MVAMSPRERLIMSLTGSADRTNLIAAQALIGISVAALLLMATVPIASGVSATGALVPEKSKQIVQHQTGGTVRSIAVRDGTAVKSGQVLIQLDDVQERATFEIADSQVLALTLELAVRQAELSGLEQLVLPTDLVKRRNAEPGLDALLRSQEAAFAARRHARTLKHLQIEQALAQNAQSQAQAKARAKTARTQKALVDEEARSMHALFAKGLALKSRVLALERSAAGLDGEEQAQSAELLKLKAQALDLEQQRQKPMSDEKVEAAEAMRTLLGQLAAAKERSLAARLGLERTVIRAPMDGTVMALKAATVGGVIRPGEPIMEIVPTGDHLQLKARIAPRDADNVQQGMPATVRFDLALSSDAPSVEGTVRVISADALEDQRTGQWFFEAKIEIPLREARKLPASAYAPGRPAEVLIKTGSRTLLSYLLAPFDRTAFRALRES